MYPIIDSEPWLGIKSEPIEDAPAVGNVSRSWQWRERGIDPSNYPPNKTVFENIAEDILVQKPLQIRSCDLPGYPRSTFLMVFSPDGTKVASTHGNHNVYVSELASGKHVRILKGHPRTPWCIAFHPSHPQLIGSGCLGGQVRVWDISSGGSEVWNVRNETVIASIAFHPREQLLVIATYNELYFWDWSHPAPFTKVSTNNVNEKVRFVAFDSLGYKLITGISLWAPNACSAPLCTSSSSSSGPSSNGGGGGRGDNNEDTSRPSRNPDSPGIAQDMIVNSYQTLVQRYDSLVRNYQRLFMVRHRLINTPPPANTIDRGTDPMEAYPMELGRRHRPRRIHTWSSFGMLSETNNDNGNPEASTSRRPDGANSGDGDTSSDQFLAGNLDVLSFDSGTSRTQDSSSQERSLFGSRSSAFQPLNESGRSFRTVDQNERTRLLPNPFSSRSGNAVPRPAPSAPRTRRFGLERSQAFTDLHSSRTSIFTSSRPESSLGREFALRRRNAMAPNSQRGASYRSTFSSLGPVPSTSSGPATTNSSTQMSPDADNVDAQTINESLDLIRDILRDSGTRLLNLITNMSLNLMSRRSEGGDGELPRRRHMRLFTGNLRRDLLASSSDSDGDHTDILRTPNEAFREPNAVPVPNSEITEPEPLTDRVFLELGDAALSSVEFRVLTQNAEDPLASEPEPETPPLAHSEDTLPQAHSQDTRPQAHSEETHQQTHAEDTRPQTHSEDTHPQAHSEDTHPQAHSEDTHPQAHSEDTRPRTEADFDPNVPSTSRDNFWSQGPEMPSAEAYRRVQSGVEALQKHTLELANTWLRGERHSTKDLRTMWENLRRRILALERETGSQDSPGYYARSLIDRCMILTEMASLHSGRNLRSTSRNGESQRNARDAATTSETPSTSTAATEPPANTTAENRPNIRPAILRSSRSVGSRASPFSRRRVNSSQRWHTGEGPRRTRIQPRLAHRHSRRDFARSFEMSTTRHEIRMRAMQVLSVMFNMMMMCLGERGLSQVIMNMLKSLKKALALSCFMMMSNRNMTRGSATAPTQPQNEDVVRIQNAEHTGPVNVDGPDDPASPRLNPASEERTDNTSTGESGVSKPPDTGAPSTSQASVTKHDKPTSDSPPVSRDTDAQKWSQRLAVQIAAANRNNSSTARTRRDLYVECKRLKALHRTNPAAHPLIKRLFPPLSTHRIPALRRLPLRVRTATRRGQDEEPVAGPSNAPPHSNRQSSREMSEFDNRVNLIRIAHMQAVRLRNAARNRFRRLQTIRLYTPSSVFALQSNSNENQQENSSAAQSDAEGTRRQYLTYGPQVRLPPRNEADARSNETGQFHAVLNNVAMPMMQVNDQPPSSAAQRNQGQRLPRIHEYLQPIILAQNAMVVEDDGDGGGGGGGGGNVGGIRRMGMAGLLDASIISEALPAPSNRVQAWDFTTGQTPEIADSTKNVVVQKCRIHNDASIDISKDGRLLVALLPGGIRLRNTNSWLGVYSLEWARLGQCLHTAMLEQSAVSVALSPTARYLAVGLGSRRFSSAPHSRTNIIALLYKLDPLENSSRTGLSPIKELMQHWEHGFTSLNCLRWAPQPGQGLVYANNTGQLIIMS